MTKTITRNKTKNQNEDHAQNHDQFQEQLAIKEFCVERRSRNKSELIISTEAPLLPPRFVKACLIAFTCYKLIVNL